MSKFTKYFIKQVSVNKQHSMYWYNEQATLHYFLVSIISPSKINISVYNVCICLHILANSTFETLLLMLSFHLWSLFIVCDVTTMIELHAPSEGNDWLFRCHCTPIAVCITLQNQSQEGHIHNKQDLLGFLLFSTHKEMVFQQIRPREVKSI